MDAVENVSYSFFESNPINAEAIPKNNRLKPTISEISSDANIGDMINIKPNIIDNNPAVLLIIMSPPLIKLIIYIHNDIINYYGRI